VSLRLEYQGQSAETYDISQGDHLTAIDRSDPSGGMSIADRGTALAEARTRAFDVLPHNQYSAVGMLTFFCSFVCVSD